MRLLIYEHLCATPVPAADSLRTEGLAMLLAVLEDALACPDSELVTLAAPAMLPLLRQRFVNVEVHPAIPGEEEMRFRRLARTASLALVIAPEFANLLESRCRWATEEGCTLLGPAPESVRLCGDKLTLARHFSERGIPTPPTVPCRAGASPPFAYPVVVKPRRGAGSLGVARIDDEPGYRAHLGRLAREEEALGEAIVQPWIPGQAVSVAGLGGPAGVHLLPACRQHLAEETFAYQGGSLPLPTDLAHRAGQLAQRAACAVPGLAGYFGIDLVLGPAPEEDQVIEVNPRLTTSYVGLRRLAPFNLFRALIDTVVGRPTGAWAWRQDAVRFTATGRILE